MGNDSPLRDPRSLAKHAKAEARRLGFDLVGITAADPPPHLEVYETWLAEGKHGEMGYLASDRARKRRADPRRILPECQSILVVGVSYLPRSEENTDGPVATYALGQDYHQVLKNRLQRLVAAIEAAADGSIPHRIYIDTGPLLEREFGQRAGLGWIGKNTCLIHPRRGSFFFLGEVLLGIALAPDAPFTVDHCGTCTRCIEACPTRCILPDRTIDARRCISYLTIELKGTIPVDLRSQMGSWVFGCDICQQVCPWNLRFAPSIPEPSFQARSFLLDPDLKAFLRLDQEGFKREFRDSPLKRAKLRGLLRNAAIAAGNSRDPRLIPALSRLLREDAEPLVRAHAAWALGQIGGVEAQAVLRKTQESEEDESVLAEINAALA